MKIPVQLLLFGLVVAVVLVLAEVHQRNKTVQSVRIDIKNAAQNLQDTSHFLTENEILRLMHQDAQTDVSELSIKEIDVKKIENSVKTNTFVADAEVSLDAKGVLHIEIDELKPLARVLSSNPSKGAYITESGTLVPLSPNFTARVMLLSASDNAGEFLDSIFWKTPDGKVFLDALKQIDKDPFWRAQITQIHSDKSGNLTAYPQIGEQIIELGDAQQMESKLFRLKKFYKEIIPKKGWGNYKKVSVRYDGQIVCQ